MTHKCRSNLHKYLVERIGHNDGLPYLVSVHPGPMSGELGLEVAQGEAPKCEHRLISVHKVSGPYEVFNTD